jgi:hypothetical protein
MAIFGHPARHDYFIECPACASGAGCGLFIARVFG